MRSFISVCGNSFNTFNANGQWTTVKTIEALYFHKATITSKKMSNKEQPNEQAKMQQRLQSHINGYPIKLNFPANLFSVPTEGIMGADSNYASATDSPKLRTSSDFVQYRLLDSNLLFEMDESGAPGSTKDSSQSLSTVSQELDKIAGDLESTGCYDSVQLSFGRPESNDKGPNPRRELDVVLKEKNWYKLYVGGGIKHEFLADGGINGGMGGLLGMIPKVQFESSAGLINLTGHADVSSLAYNVDQTGTPTLSFSHTRPLYNAFGEQSSLGDRILNMDQGSKFGLTLRGMVDTLDFEHTRSCRDHIQLLGFRIANTMPGSLTGGGSSGTMEKPYLGIDWTLSHRDVLPRRHVRIPYLCDASPDILVASGPSLKHSVSAEYKLNGAYTDNRFNPTFGLDSHGGVELAGPPGDVGFLKCWGGSSFHLPLLKKVSMHLSVNGGFIKPLSYGGLCSSGNGMTNIIDRFYVGGPHQLRGFLPSGIGPRAKSVSPFFKQLILQPLKKIKVF